MDYKMTPEYNSPRNAEEINATSAPLQSAAYALGEYCKSSADAYMLCKRDTTDPGVCLKQGKQVTQCAFDLYSFSFYIFFSNPDGLIFFTIN